MSKYNATVYQLYYDNSEAKGTFVASVETINGKPQMLRSNSATCTGFEDKLITEDIPELDAKKGDAAYHVYMKQCAKKLGSYYHIVLGDCEGYKNRLRQMALPPTYQL